MRSKLVVLLSLLPSVLAAQAVHPLEPLTLAETDRAAAIIKADSRFTRDSKFATLGIDEPAKQQVLAWSPGMPVRRAARAAIFDWKTTRTASRAPTRFWRFRRGISPKRAQSWSP